MSSVGTRTSAPTATPAAGRISGPVWAALGVVYVVWGSTYLGIRVVVESMPALFSGAVRFLAAGALLLALLAVREGVGVLKVTGRQLAASGAVGLLLLVGGNGGVVIAEGSVPSGLAALLVAAVPLYVVVLRTVSGDRPGWAALAGVLLGLGGLAVLAVPGSGGSVKLGGVLLVLAAGVSWAVGSFASARLPMPGNPLVASAYEMLIGGAGCAVVSLLRGEQHGLHLGEVTTRSWVALAYLVLVGSLLGFTAYAWLLQRAPLGLVSTYAYVNPVVAVFLGWLVLGERLTGAELLGGLIVVAAVCVVVTTARRGKA
ncbi:EamA family transporter [Kitasatospora sp. NPDC058965]|uniref:EamA family transporter n=1 Tax=Kitasatospora sp. NPDC058965 TaxID=3346682 RepID=UPI00369BAAD4